MDHSKGHFLIDTHAHLTLTEAHFPLDEQMAQAREHHVARILDPGLHPSDFAERKAKLAPFPEVILGVALAPHHSQDYKPSDLDLLETICRDEKPAAISEIGLEYLLMKDNHAFQRQLFSTQLELAKKFHLPVFLHVREAYADTIEVVKASGVRRGAVHCFTGNLDDARHFLDLGFYLSFSGIVTFKSAKELHDVARFVPADRLLTETDAPYLAPVPKRGEKNRADYVRFTNAFLAELRGNDPMAFNAQLWDNAHALLGL